MISIVLVVIIAASVVTLAETKEELTSIENDFAILIGYVTRKI